MKRFLPTSSGPLRKDVRASDCAKGASAALRDDLSPPELHLWLRIKRARQLGYPFRRQHPLGPYIADFYCHRARLVIEVDGAHHLTNVEHDHARDRWMVENGLVVVRFTAIEVGRDPDAAAATCLRIARERCLEVGGGGDVH
ncbi:MAG: endonuclease domain-containing protein [Phycisphaerales bacterium]|nr:endonuclease domain-containing protein [Phycisphaerales bacterium]